ncbi:MAG: hypothetical protein HC927_11605 [Deltaproteobacteria bacterium]|nr:hypothetical protein [Deltaproteobacteria bacterium]
MVGDLAVVEAFEDEFEDASGGGLEIADPVGFGFPGVADAVDEARDEGAGEFFAAVVVEAIEENIDEAVVGRIAEAADESASGAEGSGECGAPMTRRRPTTTSSRGAWANACSKSAGSTRHSAEPMVMVEPLTSPVSTTAKQEARTAMALSEETEATAAAAAPAPVAWTAILQALLSLERLQRSRASLSAPSLKMGYPSSSIARPLSSSTMPRDSR